MKNNNARKSADGHNMTAQSASLRNFWKSTDEKMTGENLPDEQMFNLAVIAIKCLWNFYGVLMS